MKTKLILIPLLLCILNIHAQDKLDNVLTLIQDGKIIESQTEIEKIINEESGKANPKAWLYRGAVYQLVHENNIKIDGLEKDPLNISYYSFLKCIKLDVENEYLQQSLQSLGIISNLFVRKGIDEFNNGDYLNSLESFENCININKMPAIMYLDTVVLYNAAFAAEKCEKYDIAHKYYKELIILDFEKAKMYEEDALLYKKEGDISNYLITLKEGLNICKENNTNLIIELVNYYLSVDDKKEVDRYLNMAIEKEPANANNYFIKGSILEQKGDIGQAEEYYLKSIKYDPNHIDALYNLGAIYYNQGVDLIKDAKTKTEKEAADEKYKKAIPYFEKVHKLDDKDTATMSLLLILYKITKQEDKQKEIEAKLEKLQ